MWSVLYNLWRYNKKTECPEELDFAWATDPISRIDEVNIYHNAGVPTEYLDINNEKLHFFHKGKGVYVNNIMSPHSDMDNLTDVTDKYCTYWYLNELKKVNNPIF